jgi:hypothetical protein
LFIEQFRSFIETAQDEYERLGYDDILTRIHSYKTSMKNWWCLCPAYKSGPYHLCKHIVVLYIGEEGLRSNKPRIPFYGQVWRQPFVPPLWVAGVHDESLLIVRDLQASNPHPPILQLREAVPSPLNNAVIDIEPDEHFDTDEDEVEEEEGEEGDNSEERSEKDTTRDAVDGEEDQWEDDGGFNDDDFGAYLDETARLESDGIRKIAQLRQYHNDLLRIAQAVESEAGNPHVSLMPELTPQNMADVGAWATRWHAEQRQREEMVEKVRSFEMRLHHLIQACQNALEYGPTHLYIREIPGPTISNTPAMMDWADSWHRLQNGTVRRPTWSPDRRRNMHCD